MKYLINDNMKAVRCGDFVKADQDAREFIYDTMAPKTEEHNIAVMRGIAEAHNFVVPDNLNKRGDIARRLANDLSKLKLPEVRKMSDTEQVTSIIVEGVKAEKTDDQILVAIVNAGISFKNAGKLFKQVMQEKGLRISSKSRQEQVFKILKSLRFKPKADDWEKVQAALDKIVEEVNDTDEKQALMMVKRYAKEGELILPKQPKKAAGAKGNVKVQEYMIANPSATKEEFSTFMLDLGKKEKMIDRQWVWFEIAQKMAANIK
jgi:hypothetical protein